MSDVLEMMNSSNVFIVKLDHDDDRNTMVKELNQENLLMVNITYVSSDTVSNGGVKISSDDSNVKTAEIYLSTNTYAAIAGLRVALSRLFTWLKNDKDANIKSIYVTMNDLDSGVKAAVVPTFEEYLIMFKRDATNVYFEKLPEKMSAFFANSLDYRISKEFDEDNKKKKKKKGKK